MLERRTLTTSVACCSSLFASSTRLRYNNLTSVSDRTQSSCCNHEGNKFWRGRRINDVKRYFFIIILSWCLTFHLTYKNLGKKLLVKTLRIMELQYWSGAAILGSESKGLLPYSPRAGELRLFSSSCLNTLAHQCVFNEQQSSIQLWIVPLHQSFLPVISLFWYEWREFKRN